jgi:hypothetical protein
MERESNAAITADSMQCVQKWRTGIIGIIDVIRCGEPGAAPLKFGVGVVQRDYTVVDRHSLRENQRGSGSRWRRVGGRYGPERWTEPSNSIKATNGRQRLLLHLPHDAQ